MEVHLFEAARIEGLQQCRGWGTCASDISLLHYIHVANDWLPWARYPSSRHRKGQTWRLTKTDIIFDEDEKARIALLLLACIVL